MDRPTLAGLIDHTLLRPEATDAEVEVLCAEATELMVGAVCVSPARLPLTGELGRGIEVATVVGFPSGAHRSPVKADEAARAVEDGATEVDMVVDLGSVMDGQWDRVEADVLAVRAAAPAPTVLKVILETAALSDALIVAACEAAERAGADYVKTSTGFHPSGGATRHAVELMAATVGGRLGIKASGGIRDAPTALEMLAAGATRLGCSASRQILDGLDPV